MSKSDGNDANLARFTQGVRVHAVLTGPVDTDMTRTADIPKASPESVARAIFDAIEKEEDIFPDPCPDPWPRTGATASPRRSNAKGRRSRKPRTAGDSSLNDLRAALRFWV
jgi:NAD(P)-dependent dehydrogenase (short-subunit alcohol dehydrogenase family)